jgi:hypothetical protein
MSMANAEALAKGLAQRNGELSESVLEWRGYMPGILRRAGRHAEALAECRDLEKDCNSQLGQANELTLDAGSDLAWFLMESGSLDSARQIARDVHSRATLAFGDSDDITDKTRGVLAGVLIAQGELDAAASLYGNWQLPDDLGIQQTFQGSLADVVDAGPRLYIYFETWCPYSHNRVPKLETQYRRFREQGIEFIALTGKNISANEESVEQFIRDWEISFAVHEEDGTAWKSFGRPGTPTMFLVDNGQILWKSGWNPTDQMFEGLVAAHQDRTTDTPSP